MGVDQRVVDGLREQGHEVAHLRDEGLHRMADEDVFAKAIAEDRIVLTFDLDFGEIAALSRGRKASVVQHRTSSTGWPRRSPAHRARSRTARWSRSKSHAFGFDRCRSGGPPRRHEREADPWSAVATPPPRLPPTLSGAVLIPDGAIRHGAETSCPSAGPAGPAERCHLGAVLAPAGLDRARASDCGSSGWGGLRRRHPNRGEIRALRCPAELVGGDAERDQGRVATDPFEAGEVHENVRAHPGHALKQRPVEGPAA